MYEYGWVYGGQGPGNSSSYYVGILQYNSTRGLGYFLTTQYTNNPNTNNYYQYWDYYYSGSGWSTSYSLTCLLGCPNLNYYFLEDYNGNIHGQNGGSNYFAFMPPDQQKNSYYSQYGVFWLYNWFQAENNAENNNMNIFFLMNGNIFNYSLASVYYQWNGGSAYAIPPNPPASTINGEPIFVQSYINAYNTAFNQPVNRQNALSKYLAFTFSNVNSNFIPGTFGYAEEYNKIGERFFINHLTDNLDNYMGTPYLFISAGSGGGSGFMYLDWIIVTYGVPYVVSVS
jgi:hypothetical protein